MFPSSRAWIAQGTFVACGIAAAFASTAAMAATTLQVKDGSGDFSQLSSWTSVEQPKDLQMAWSTDQQASTGGTWQVTTTTCVRCPAVVVASGEAPRGTGAGTWFTIPAGTFLKSPGTDVKLTFNVQITAHDADFQVLGASSTPVTVYQFPPSGGIIFGDAGNYPKVEIVAPDDEQNVLKFGITSFTLRVSNKSNTATVPALLSVKDENVLMKQSTKVSVPSLAPGASQLVNVQMTAMLAINQTLASWQQMFKDDCGPRLTSLLDYAGPPAQSPTTSQMQAPLVREGFGDYANGALATTICDGKNCINVCKLEKEIRSRLDGHVVGYGLLAGQYPRMTSGGLARTAADGGAVNFTPQTKLSVGSVSKFVTAVGTIAVLDKYNVSVDAAIGPYLPADWSPTTYIKNLTFAQLLSQTTGIKTYGNVAQTYAQLKTFFTQSIDANPLTNKTACPGNTTTISTNPINPNNMGYCYSNYNFAILRILLPKVAGYAEDANQAARPQTLANQFQTLVQQNVFDKVGQTGVACKPPANATYGWAHLMPGSSMGTDFGNETLVCGAASWVLSVEDLAKMLMSLNAGDGKILKTSPDRYAQMRTRGFGLDVAGNGEIEKNGAWGSSSGNLNSTSIAVFGPVAGNGPRVLATLLLDSDISGGLNAGGGAKAVLEQAYKASIYKLP